MRALAAVLFVLTLGATAMAGERSPESGATTLGFPREWGGFKSGKRARVLNTDPLHENNKTVTFGDYCFFRTAEARIVVRSPWQEGERLVIVEYKRTYADKDTYQGDASPFATPCSHGVIFAITSMELERLIKKASEDKLEIGIHGLEPEQVQEMLKK